MAVNSSLTSQHSRRPPGARPRAMQIDEYPVNVPTSTARRAPTRRVSSVEQGALVGADLHAGGAAELGACGPAARRARRRAGAVRSAM